LKKHSQKAVKISYHKAKDEVLLVFISRIYRFTILHFYPGIFYLFCLIYISSYSMRNMKH